MELLLHVNNYKHGDLIFQVTSNKFNGMGICSSWNYSCKWTQTA